jgi:hypothetical protein
VECKLLPQPGHLSLSFSAADGAPCASRRAARFALLTVGPVSYSYGRRLPGGPRPSRALARHEGTTHHANDLAIRTPPTGPTDPATRTKRQRNHTCHVSKFSPKSEDATPSLSSASDGHSRTPIIGATGGSGPRGGSLKHGCVRLYARFGASAASGVSARREARAASRSSALLTTLLMEPAVRHRDDQGHRDDREYPLCTVTPT